MIDLPEHVPHGASNAYSNYKCRCDDCRTWRCEENRAYRSRNINRFRSQRRAEYAANPERFKELTKARTDRHRRIIDRYKLMVGCVRCGYRESPYALHLHHRDPAEKSFTVSISIGRAWASVKAGIRKCDVLCANCHAITHHEERAAA